MIRPGAPAGAAVRRARRRDRRVYLGSHPVLFAVLAATRGVPVRRLGRTVLVHDRQAFVDGLTRVRLDRTAPRTTGGAAGALTGGDLLFDQDGAAHRAARRALGDTLGPAGVARLRPMWTDLLHRRLAPLHDGGLVDLVDVAAELAGATAAALLGLGVDGRQVDGRRLAAAARAAAAAAARAHLPGLPRPGRARAARQAADRLAGLVGPGPAGLGAMLAVAAVTTTVAALPRAAAWCADADWWRYAADEAAAGILAAELFRALAPTPLLPRVAAEAARLAGCPVRPGDRLLLVARHAVDAHRAGPDPVHPAPARTARLVFGVGGHACPGAGLARAQLTDLLLALAGHRPVVVRARVDRRAALPGWARLLVRARR